MIDTIHPVTNKIPLIYTCYNLSGKIQFSKHVQLAKGVRRHFSCKRLVLRMISQRKSLIHKVYPEYPQSERKKKYILEVST